MVASTDSPKEKMDAKMKALFALSIVFLLVGGGFLLVSFLAGIWYLPDIGLNGTLTLQLIYFFSPALFVMGLIGLIYTHWPIADHPKRRDDMPSLAVFGALIIIIGIVYDLITRIVKSGVMQSGFNGFAAIPSDFGGGGLGFVIAALIVVMMGYAVMRKEWTYTIVIATFALFINIIAVIGLILIVMAKDDLIEHWRKAKWLSKINVPQAKILVAIGCIPPIIVAASITLVMMLQIQNDLNWQLTRICEALAFFVTPPIVMIGAMRWSMEEASSSQNVSHDSNLRNLSSLGGVMVLLGAVLTLYIGLGTYFTYHFAIPPNTFDPLTSMIVVPFGFIGGLLAVAHRNWMAAILLGSTILLVSDPELTAIGVILIAFSREAFVRHGSERP